MVYGNVKGIKKSVLDRLDALTGDYEKNLLIDREVLFDVADITEKINREICVFVTRSGRITTIGVG
ncbi:MAG: GTPase HflX, partial [Eubacteriales bacterium]|nr:GTPase HflX [Eubacteriales bacterium]